MADQSGAVAVPSGPPWPVDIVADVHAGLYPPELNRQLRERMMADPQARATLTALGSVVDELSLLPPLTMPDRYASRLATALDAEAQSRSVEFRGTVPTRGVRPAVWRTDLSPLLEAAPSRPADEGTVRIPRVPAFPPIPAPRTGPDPTSPSADEPTRVVRPDAGDRTQRIDPDLTSPGRSSGPGGPPRLTAEPPPAYDASGNVTSLEAARRRRRGRITGIIGLAAAVAVVGVVAFVATRPSASDTNTANPAPGTTVSTLLPSANAAQFTVDPGDLTGAFAQVTGHWTQTDLIVFEQCLESNGLGGKTLLGSSAVTYQGRPATALAVALDDSRALLLIVGPTCGRDGAQALASQTVSR